MRKINGIIGSLTLTLTLAASLQAQAPFTNGLVAFYPFNGDANDASGNGNNGTVNGAILAPDRFGNPNRAYFFNGSNTIVATDHGLPMGNASRTFSVWVNCLTSATNRAYAIPLCYGVLASHQGNWINVFTGNDGTGRPKGSVLFDFYNSSLLSTNLIGLNKWQHLVCTLGSSSTASIYINGQLVGVGSVHPNTTSSGEMFIGGRNGPDSTNVGVIGSMDDVRIYARALSASEVQQLYEYESGPRVNFVKAFTVDFSNLTLSSNYQLQASADVKTWTNYGAPFTATSSSYTNTDYQRIEDWNKLFFRLEMVP